MSLGRKCCNGNTASMIAYGMEDEERVVVVDDDDDDDDGTSRQ
jgi:hypothetical protein